jgi:hypothetical protein
MTRKQKNIMLIRSFCERFGFGYPRRWMLVVMAILLLFLIGLSYGLFMFAVHEASTLTEQASPLASHAPHFIMLFTAIILLLAIKAADLMCELCAILRFFHNALSQQHRDDDAS